MVVSADDSLIVSPRCAVFGSCGGCSYQDISYDEELRRKNDEVTELFYKTLNCSSIEFEPIVASPIHYNYRNRLDLKLKRFKNGDIKIGFTSSDGKETISIDACPIAREEISEFIPVLKKEAGLKITEKYNQANLVIRSGEERKVKWGGIGRRSLQTKEEEYFFTTLGGRKIFYSLDTFFQANLSILPSVFEVITKANVLDKDKIFLDLYGGVGLFSVGLASLYKEAFLIENSVDSLRLAAFNKNYNKLENLHLIQGNVEDKLGELFSRISLKDTIAMIDPPRGGLAQNAAESLAESGIPSLIYLSCSPSTLVRDLLIFQNKGWDIRTVIPFDFFPRTKHIETLVFLRR